MLFGPFVGLSIIVHVILIFVYKLFRLKPSKYLANRKRIFGARAVITYGFSLVITAVIFGIAFTSAEILVKHSLYDKHSTIRIINKEYSVLSSIYFYATVTTPPPTLPTDCQRRLNDLTGLYRNSLVHYLRVKGLSNSFAERKALAKWYGIENYSGSYEQDNHLFKIVLIKLNDLPPDDSPACKKG